MSSPRRIRHPGDRAAGAGTGPRDDRAGDVRSVIRVRYGETDCMGVAYHGSYAAWFEIGRTDWLRGPGPGLGAGDHCSYRRLEEAGYFLPVVELTTKYHSPARYDDEVEITTRLVGASRVRFAFEYEARRKDGAKLLATGSSTHAVTDETGALRRLSAERLEWILRGRKPRAEEQAGDN